MGQNITIKIGGQTFSIVAANPEAEQAYRLAAEDASKLLAKYDERFTGKSDAEKLALVCLQEAVGKITAQRRIGALAGEMTGLKDELDTYLKGIEKKK